ncbi:MAG TPA: hypothetical protein DCF49_02395 [Lachnospiraceae bacterium]|nr:hypothetical protein [Lachnospiraceae bacterium]
MKRISLKKAAVFIASLLAAVSLWGCSPVATDTMQKADEALEKGDFDSASALYDAAIEEGKQLQACYRGKGIALMGKMEYKDAAEAFEKALESATFVEKNLYHDGMEDDIRRYLASCYIHKGEPEKAVLVYDALIKNDDENITLYMERGTAKAASGDLDSAKLDFDKAINMDRHNYQMILDIAQTFDKYGGREYGVGYLADVRADREDTIDPVLKGRILYFLEDYEGAVNLLSSSAKTDEEAAMITCRCFMALKNMKSAREVLDSMGEKVERSPSLLNLSGNIYFRQKKFKKAAEVFEKAASVASGSTELQDILFNRAVAYEYAGDFAKAKELFTDYLKQYSGDKQAVRELKFLNTR